MLIGQYTSKLTDKDRLSVPKKIRDEMGDDLIVAKWYENCLVLVSKGNWEALIKRIKGEPGLIVAPVRDIDRFVLGSAFEISLDGQGRFVLPEILSRFAKILDEVVFVALSDRVEIWSRNVWEQLESEAYEKAFRAVEEIAKAKI